MTLAYIPSPTISQFSIGPVTIHFYALCILLGIVLAVWMTTVHWKRYGGNFDQILDITLVAVPSGIIGARIYHIITTPERFFGPTGDWVEMFRIWNGGLGIWGGVLLGALAAWAWCRHKHYPMALLGDAVARVYHDEAHIRPLDGELCAHDGELLDALIDLRLAADAGGVDEHEYFESIPYAG